MSDKNLKRFDVYLHLNEEMKAIKDVCVEEYNYEQLILDAHDLALLQFPKCSKESVFVSHERMVRGRRCKTTLTCDYGLKRLFSSNQTAYVFFVKCYDGVPGLGLMGKVKSKRSNNSSLVEEVDGCDSNEDLIKQVSTSLVENVLLASVSEVDEERMMVSSNELNQMGDRTNHVSVTQAYGTEGYTNKKVYVRKRGKVSSSEPAVLHRQDMVGRVNVPLASDTEVVEEMKIATMAENVTLTSIAEVDEESMMMYSNQLDQMGDRTNHVSVRKGGKISSSQQAMLHQQDMVAIVDVPLASVTEVVEEMKITTMAENATLASIAEVDEESMMVYSNQLDQIGDRTNHVSVTRVYVRKGRKISSSQQAMLHQQDMVARVDVPLASISEIAEGRKMMSYIQLGDRSNHAFGYVYVRKRKPVKQVE